MSDGHKIRTNQVPSPRVDRAPVDQRDFEDRHQLRATHDDQTLQRYIRLGWHRVGQRLAFAAGLMTLFLMGTVVMHLAGVPPDTAVRLTLAMLISASGYGLLRAVQLLHDRRRRIPLLDEDKAVAVGTEVRISPSSPERQLSGEPS